MRRPRTAREVVLSLAVLAAAFGMLACSGAASLEATGDPLVAIELSPSAVTVANNTGTSLVSGEIHVMPNGFPRPYFVLLPRMSNGEKRTFPLDTFRMSDGTRFRINGPKARSVKVIAKDVVGKDYSREVPFR